MTWTGARIWWRSPRTRTSVLVDAYERHHQALYRYCRSIVHHEQDAQDALQSTLTRAYAALPDEPRTLELRPWLFRIAHNEAVSILRRRRSTVELDESVGHPATIEDGLDARETLRMLRRDIADLPERQRTALVLRELNGLGLAEIAQVLDTTPEAVKQAVFDARRALSHCREGRALACREVQLVLSDGDGRKARSRGMRAHVRECSECRRFEADLARRPRDLAALAPPLPAATAATILAGLQGGASTTAVVSAMGGLSAKLTVGLVLATSGATAVQVTRSHEPPPAPEREALAPQRTGTATPARMVVARTPRSVPRQAKREAQPPNAYASPEPVRAAAPAPPSPAKKDPASRAETPEQVIATAPGQATRDAAARTEPPGETTRDAAARTEPPGETKRDAAARTEPPGETKRDAAARTEPPGQAKKDQEPPGQAKKDATPPGQAKRDQEPPGQAKKDATPPAPATTDDEPPGQAKKDAAPPAPATTDEGPPGQAKKDAAPPGHGG